MGDLAPLVGAAGGGGLLVALCIVLIRAVAGQGGAWRDLVDAERRRGDEAERRADAAERRANEAEEQAAVLRIEMAQLRAETDREIAELRSTLRTLARHAGRPDLAGPPT